MCTIILFFCCCGQKRVPTLAPRFDHRPDTLFAGQPDSLVFVLAPALPAPWRFTLLTGRQPIPLSPVNLRDRVVIRLDNEEGFTEGPAVILYSLGARSFFYPLRLAYGSGVDTVCDQKEYHSPKTVNPDSSLMQQRIIFGMDRQRNLLLLPSGLRKGSCGYFYSDSIWLPAVTATYLPQPRYPVSAIYVQPGTNTAFGLEALYVVSDSAYAVTTGVIRDIHRNIVADGTAVSFLVERPSGLYRVEASTYEGIATVRIAVDTCRSFSVSASINMFHSRSLTIKSPL
jgi:hypothetical protein